MVGGVDRCRWAAVAPSSAPGAPADPAAPASAPAPAPVPASAPVVPAPTVPLPLPLPTVPVPVPVPTIVVPPAPEVPSLVVGDTVKLLTGVNAGLTGTITSIDSAAQTAVVQVTLLGLPAQLTMPLADLQKL